MSTIKLRWEVTKATEHDYWAYNNILRIYIRYNVQSQKMEWETCPINGGARAKNGKSDTMPEAISAAKKAASDLLLEDLEPSPAPVVLEWVEGKGENASFFAFYNDHIRAEVTANQGGFCNAFTFINNRVDVIKMSIPEPEAHAWCVKQITKIITPAP